jgi:hypothetical protein
MKLTFLLLLIPFFSFGQNLVPNPSFEDTINCNLPKFWYSIIGTPDYFNKCDLINGNNTPSNWAGYQNALGGKSYIGLIGYFIGGGSIREIVGVNLLNNLSIGQKYFISIKISLADSSKYGSNNIGVAFYTYNPTSLAIINNYTKVHSNIIISDTTNWITIFGAFTADSTYGILAIGNLYNDSFTSTDTVSNSHFPMAYYYIDDVCLSIDSSFTYNYHYTYKNEIPLSKEMPNLSPNPTSDRIFLNISPETDEIALFNSIGQQLNIDKGKNQEFYSLDISSYPNGIYFLKIKSKINSKTIKFIKK